MSTFWVKTSERLPEMAGYYLTSDWRGPVILWASPGTGWFEFAGGDRYRSPEYWAPLPQAPDPIVAPLPACGHTRGSSPMNEEEERAAEPPRREASLHRRLDGLEQRLAGLEDLERRVRALEYKQLKSDYFKAP